MTLFLPRTEKTPSTGQKLSMGIGRGLDIGAQLAQKHKSEQQMQAENEAAQRMGIDLAGIQDPELRKVITSELIKQQGKNQRASDEQSFLENLLKKNQSKKENPQAQEPGLKEQSESGFNPSNIDDESIFQATVKNPKLGSALRSAKDASRTELREGEKAKQTKFQSDREYHSKVSQPIVDSAQSIVSQAPVKRSLINQQRRDIASGNTSGILPFLVDELGLEIYRNPESARFKTANKNRFIETVHELGGSQARPNQFIERQISEAQTALGRDQESNMTTLDLEEFIDDMKLQRAKLELQLAEEDREKYGYAKNDIAMRADKLMGDYSDKRQDQMAYDIRQRKEENMSDEDLTRVVLRGVPDDTPLTLRAARILMLKNNDDEKKAQAEAKKLGFRMPNESSYMR